MAFNDSKKFVSPEQLCVGLFVELELEWLEHPFPFNRFRIKSPSQLQALKELGLKRIRYDPARSKSIPLALPSSGHGGHVEEEDSPAPKAREVEVSPVLDLNADKVRRVERIKAQHLAINECEKNFRTAYKVLHNINHNLFSQPAKSIESARKLVDKLVRATLTDREVSLTLMNNKIAGGEVFDHSLNVAVLGMIIAQQMGIDGDELRQLGLSCLFHDLGKAEISPSILNKSPPLTAFEQKVLKSHVRLGVEIGERIGLSPQVLNIIAQHHERMDGSGYPKQLKEEAICMEARIICVVNDFDCLCNPVDPQKAMSPHEALRHMYSRRRKEYDAIVISQFIRNMGVYPPGTLVALTNGVPGLVLSINTDKPLKPTVMVYDGSVSRRNAIILDLDEEPDLGIVEEIKRTSLSIEAASYLNPRNRIAYFTQEQQ